MSKLNKYAEGKIINSFSRADEVSVSTDTKDAMESISVAHMAAGNTSEAIIGFDVLRKFQTQNNIEHIMLMQAEQSQKTNTLLEKVLSKKKK